MQGERESQQLSRPPFAVACVCVDPHLNTLVGGTGGIAKYAADAWTVVPLATGEQQPAQPAETCTLICTSETSEWVFFATDQRNVYKLHGWRMNSVSLLVAGVSAPVLRLAFVDRRKQLCVFCEGGRVEKVNTYGLRSDKANATGVDLRVPLTCVAVFGAPARAVLGTSDGGAHLLDLERDECTDLIRLGEPLTAVCLSGDERFAVFGGAKLVFVVSVLARTVAGVFAVVTAPVVFVAVDATNNAVLVVGRDGEAQEVDFETGAVLHKVAAGSGAVALVQRKANCLLLAAKGDALAEIPLTRFGVRAADWAFDRVRTFAKEAAALVVKLAEALPEHGRVYQSMQKQFKDTEEEKSRTLADANAAHANVKQDVDAHLRQLRDTRLGAIKCNVCFTEPSNMWFQPCNHIIMCKNCSQNIRKRADSAKCPVCKKNIAQMEEIGRHLVEYDDLK